MTGTSGWPWLTRIYGGEQPVGAGVLITENWVLTCAHVVDSALDREGELGPPTAAIALDLPAVSSRRYTAHVLEGGWVPVDPDDETGDLAVLVLDDCLPAGVPLAPLRAVDEPEGVRFRAIGFPRGRAIGSAAAGEVRDPIGPGWQWAQLVSAAGPRVRKGYSGSPVWSEKHRAVIGLVVSEDTGETDARGGAMLPLTEAARLWPPLADLIPTGILLDPAFASHWDPKARGVTRSKDPGDYFFGRGQVLSELVRWLSRPLQRGDVAGRLVTGSPGTGKSAVLSRLAVLSDAAYRVRHRAIIAAAPSKTLPPENSIDLAVHAAGLTLAEVTSRLAAAAGVQDDDKPSKVVTSIINRDQALTLLIDALDEAAGGGEDIVRELLRPMALDGRHAGIRMLVGGRPHLYGELGIDSSSGKGDAFTVLDLDAPKYFQPYDLFSSIRAQLLLEQTPTRPTPYRNKPKPAEKIADAVVTRLLHPRANGAFLIGQIVANTLANAVDPVDTSISGWASHFATSVGGALDDRLTALGTSDARRARDLLRALAYSEAPIPQGIVWVTMANVLARRTNYDLNDLAWLLEGPASSWLVQSWQRDGERVYALYHQALSDHLRPAHEEILRQRDITMALLTLVPEHKEYRNWSRTPAYVLKHLAVHARRAGMIDAVRTSWARMPHDYLLTDAEYVLRTDPAIVQISIDVAISDEQQKEALRRTIYDQRKIFSTFEDWPDEQDFESRAKRLEFNARQYGLDQLADDVDRVAPARTWSVPWAHLWGDGEPLHNVEPHGCSISNVHGAAVMSSDGEQQVALTDFGGVQLRQLSDGILRMELGRFQYSLEQPVGLTEGSGHMAWVWGAEGWEPAYPYGHMGPALSVATGQIDAQRAIVSGGQDGTVVLWHAGLEADCNRELDRQRRRGQKWKVRVGRKDDNFPRPNLSWVRAVSLIDIAHHPFVVACHLSGSINFIDAKSGEEVGAPLHYGDYLWCAATGDLNGTPILVAGGTASYKAKTGQLQAWDLLGRAKIGRPMDHSRTVRSVTLTEVDGRTVAVTIDELGTLRLWDVETSDLIREHQNLDYLAATQAVAIARLHGRRTLVRTARNFSLAILDFDSFEELEFIHIGSEILSISAATEYVVVGCMRGALALKWRAR